MKKINTEDLLKDTIDYEDYTDNIFHDDSKRGCCCSKGKTNNKGCSGCCSKKTHNGCNGCSGCGIKSR